MAEIVKISIFDLIGIALRSFFVQACWNFNKMQGLGFLFMIRGTLSKIYKDKELFTKSLLKYADFFNTNPYFAPAIAGAVMKYEEELAIQGTSSFNPEAIKASLMGPFGAIGDSLFWSTLRPVISAVAIFAALANISYAPIIFLGVYGIISIVFRFYATFIGYKYGKDIINKISRLNLYTLINRLKNIMALILGAVIPLLEINKNFMLVGHSFFVNILIAFGIVNLCFVLFLKRLTTTAVIFIVMFGCIMYAYIFPL
ncbi:MAG: hypothetical protein D6734_04005 [Candidatus Schekmanbacteria bacterium]|nr:MAG: hypothetical protein D6734_04005 [Candidatus Schekmanbacteria bacterium]